MTGIELFGLLPIIMLSTVILLQMMAIAFARNLKATVRISVIGLTATLICLYRVAAEVPITVTPLISIDGYAVFFSGLILVAAIAITLMAYDYFKDRGAKQDEFFMLLLLATLGGLILVSSTHFAAFILGLELLGVSLYTMMSYPVRGVLTLESALKYLILSGVSSAFILFGAALLYAATGSLSFDTLAVSETGNIYLAAGTAMVLAGIMFKLSLVPFHMWTPDVYEGAPAPVTAFVATVSKGAIFAVLLRLFAGSDLYTLETILPGLAFVAILSMLVGNLLALRQDSVKRILAYSSIAHLGYLMVAFIAAGITGGKELAIEASGYFLFAYFVTTVGAFGVVTILSINNADHDLSDLSEYTGLFWRHPVLATMFTAILLSLAGIPLTVGFIGKFYIFASGVQATLWLLLGVVILGSGIGLYYYLRIIFTMTTRVELTDKINIPMAGGWVMLVTTATLVLFGIYPAPIIDLINELVSSMV